MSEEKSNLCNGSSKLIFACSGAADVGEIADRAARKMAKQGTAKMFCLAGIGGRINGIINTSKSAEQILAIDGCIVNCAKASLEQAGFKEFKHVQLADLGLEKGQSPANEANVDKVVAKGEEMISS